MARLFSRLTRLRHELRGGGVFLVLAVVVFAGIVFLLFRGYGSGPQEAVAGPARPVPTEIESMVPAGLPAAVETPPDPAPTLSQAQSLPVD